MMCDYCKKKCMMHIRNTSGFHICIGCNTLNNSSRRSKYLKRQTNKRIRQKMKLERYGGRSTYKRMLDYWWEMY
jgi:hypothetical protein